ncbi:NAD-dependent epimerase/dehydratase family protein [Martelella soudanensis]|uniref:NAD-dependent epimerase/dehydratase family protein n=1 Tax=unclassified Martelella TaxID=2629616 RepID=UPI0015DF9CFE|nr:MULTISPECIES: NAD(P)-dependent oxidoreductase [unclassified Martelella]
MTVLVTGATGFIGSYLIPVLLERGYDVAATDRMPAPEWIAKLSNVFYVQTDLGREADIQKLMGIVRPEKIVHLASVLAGPCEADPLLGYRVNFMSTATLLDAGLAYGLKRFVMTSAGSVFGQGLQEPVRNDAERLPRTVYGQTKLACEHLIEWYRRVHGLSCGAVRFPWVYGPGRSTGITAEYSSLLLDRIARNEPLVISNPEERGDWLYVRDAVKALMLLLEREEQPEISYNIMGSVHSIREAMTLAMQIFPEARVTFEESARTTQPYASSYDDSKARADIGWQPEYALADGIREHVTLVRQRHVA